MTSHLADGSTLPAYEPGGSLHREDGRRVYFPESARGFRGHLPDVRDEGDHLSYTGRVHITKTNDAELLADLWGTLADREPITGALLVRFERFVADHLGADAVAALVARTDRRFWGGIEASSKAEGGRRRYAYGHTGV